MGLHEICKKYGHHFDLEHEIEVIKLEDKNDYLLSGICKECGIWRVVSYREIKRYLKNER